MEVGPKQRAHASTDHLESEVLASVAYMAMVQHQSRRLGKGRSPAPDVTPGWAFVEQQLETTVKNWKYRRWMRNQAA